MTRTKDGEMERCFQLWGFEAHILEVDAKNDLQMTEKEENKNDCDNQFCLWYEESNMFFARFVITILLCQHIC